MSSRTLQPPSARETPVSLTKALQLSPPAVGVTTGRLIHFFSGALVEPPNFSHDPLAT